jgi:polar amino acid transport system substrate-binding protein
LREYNSIINTSWAYPTHRKKEKTMKKIISILLSITMLLAMAATLTSCFGGDNDTDLVKVIDVKLTDEQYAFVAKKDNTALVNDFNSFLATIKENGTFDELVAKYFEGKGTKVGYKVTTTDVQNSDTNLIVVTNCPFEPFEYIGDDGKIYGLDIEIAAAYAESKNLELVIKNIGFDDIFTQVEAGYADIGMAGITVSEDRAAIYSFTNTYFRAVNHIKRSNKQARSDEEEGNDAEKERYIRSHTYDETHYDEFQNHFSCHIDVYILCCCQSFFVNQYYKAHLHNSRYELPEIKGCSISSIPF